MFDPQLWPAGTYVRRYFESLRHRANGSEAIGSVGGIDLQRSVNTPVATHGSHSLLGRSTAAGETESTQNQLKKSCRVHINARG